MAQLSGTPIKPRRILTVLQRRRRERRKAEGVTDIRKATPEQLANLRADDALPSGESMASVIAERRRRARLLGKDTTKAQTLVPIVGGKKGGAAGGRPVKLAPMSTRPGARRY